MPEQIALKLLRQSDLTLFDPIWQRDNEWLRLGQIERVSKQKVNRPGFAGGLNN